MKITFDSEPIYGDNDKYIKTKIKIYGDSVNTNFQGKGVPKRKSTMQMFINNNVSVVKTKKIHYLQMLLEECKY